MIGTVSQVSDVIHRPLIKLPLPDNLFNQTENYNWQMSVCFFVLIEMFSPLSKGLPFSMKSKAEIT